MPLSPEAAMIPWSRGEKEAIRTLLREPSDVLVEPTGLTVFLSNAHNTNVHSGPLPCVNKYLPS